MIFIVATIALLDGCGHKATPIAEHKKNNSSAPAEQGIAPQVTLSNSAAQEAGIVIEAAAPAALREVLTLYGVVQVNAEHMRNVVARFPGVVKTVQHSLGDKVAAGTVLATVESNDSLQTYALTAPISGAITARSINVGETISEQNLFTLTDLSTVWVDLALFARDRARVQIGQAVAVHGVDGSPTANGRIAWLATLGSSATQSVAARVVLDNKAQHWTPGLYVVGEITVAERPVALAVLSTALQTLDQQTVLFVATTDGFAARTVTIGASDGTHTEIISGLEPGTRYVAVNSFLLKADIEKSTAQHAD